MLVMYLFNLQQFLYNILYILFVYFWLKSYLLKLKQFGVCQN